MEVRMIGVALTSACNLHCKYCFVDAKREGVFLDEGSFGSFVDYFSEKAAPGVSFFFTGGEPTLHPELLKFIEKVESEFVGPRIHIVSNGAIPGALLEKLLKTRTKFRITFEGTPEIHDFERPFSGGGPSSSEVLRSVRTILGDDPDRLTVVVNHSLEKAGKEGEIADFLGSLGVRQVSVGLVLPRGRGKDYAGASLRCAERLPVLVRSLEAGGIRVDHKKFTEKSGRWPACSGGSAFFFLTADGRISACQDIILADGLPPELEDFIIGDARKGTRIFQNRLARFQEFAGKKRSECGACEFRDVCGGCPLERKLAESGRSRDDFCSDRKAVLSPFSGFRKL